MTDAGLLAAARELGSIIWAGLFVASIVRAMFNK